ncbi:MAG: citrate/2-methylcitrate synthase [Planctomycetota bacterium]
MSTDSELPGIYYPGLEGVISNETAITNLEGRKGDGDLEYRGYRIEDLADHVCYEEASYLLLHGELPNTSQLAEFDSRLRAQRSIPAELIELLRQIPKSAHGMDVLRTSLSIISHYDLEVNASPTDHAANVRKAERIVAKTATAVAARERLLAGLEPIAPDESLNHAANFLYMYNGVKPSDSMAKAFDLSLVLYAEHELNASTFAARVTVSTLSDIYSGIVAAVGTLKGSLHGGANEEAWKVLVEVGSPDHAEDWIQDALVQKKRIMGFGHRVYKTGDPRARILKVWCQKLAQEIGDDRWEKIAEPIEREVTIQKKLPPNVDWPTARLYFYMGLKTEVYTPIFALARVSGWSAHIIEQLDSNRLMRPRARYTGPANRPIKPIDQRG